MLKITIAIIILFLVIWASSTLVREIKTIDRDDDGLIDKTEYFIGSNPLAFDTDNDGIDDYNEYNYWMNRSGENFSQDFFVNWENYWNETFNIKISEDDLRNLLKPNGDLDGDNKSNICDDDSDKDDLLDNYELENGSDPAFPDLNSQPDETGGGGGGSNSGNSAQGGGGGDLDDTITEITEISSDQIYKTGFFYVKGYVTDNSDKPVTNMTIEVFVNKTKDSKGSFAGRGALDSNGFFNVTCEVPKDVEVGSNQIVAHALSNDIYSDSWSDPTINIYSDTTLILDIVSSVGADVVFPIKGSLVDADEQPLANKIVRIKWNNEFLTLDTTNNDGIFVFNWSNSTIGFYKIDVEFDGDEFLGASNDSQKITIKDMDTHLAVIFPTQTFRRGDTFLIQGQLFTGENSPIAESEIKIFYDNNLISSTTTSDHGSFNSTITIPDSSNIGEIPIKVKFSGTDYYAEATKEDVIKVETTTNINYVSPIKRKFLQNESVIVIGKVLDDKENPVENASIKLSFINFSRTVASNANGSFETLFEIPWNISNGTYILKTNFAGMNFYLSSEESISLNVGTVETNRQNSGNNSLLIILTIAILGIIVGVIALRIFKKKDSKITNIDPRSIQEIASSTINKLKNDSDYKKTVLECYKNMCKWLDASGVKKNSYDTPREFAINLQKVLSISDDCLASLTKVFEKAFYSEHEIIEDDKKTAIACLSEVITSLINRKKENIDG